jgi:hypothetical protein
MEGKIAECVSVPNTFVITPSNTVSKIYTSFCTKFVTLICSPSTFVCSLIITSVRFEDLTALSMKIAVFWVVAPCSLVEVYQRFRRTCCLHHQGDHRPVVCAGRSLSVLCVQISLPSGHWSILKIRSRIRVNITIYIVIYLAILNYRTGRTLLG